MFDKDDQEISQIIDTGLEEILSGNATLEQFLAQYADQAAVLRPELEAALWLLSNRDELRPRPGYLRSSRKRVLSRIKQEASRSGAKRSIFGFLWPQKVAYHWVAAFLVLILFFSGTGSMVAAAQGTIPGEGLYGVKRASEEIAYLLTFNEVQRVELSTSYTQRRLDEVLALLEKDDQVILDQALQDFQKQANHTIAILQTVKNVNAHDKRELAVQVYESFSEQASRMSTINMAVPEHLRGEIESIERFMLLGATKAADEANGIFDPTSTPIVVFTLTPSPSSTLASTSTPVPVDPLLPTSEPDQNEVDDFRTDPNVDPTLPDKKITKTPKPTNENRPSSPPGQSEEKPPKPEKPDNPAKPEKPEKPEKPSDKDK